VLDIAARSFPVDQVMPIADVTAPALLAALRVIETRGRSTARS